MTTGKNRRLWMRLRDRYQLIGYMTQRGLSCRELGRWARCSGQMIGHLRTGEVATCTPALAARIEKALNVEPGALFEPRFNASRVSNVLPNTRQRNAS